MNLILISHQFNVNTALNPYLINRSYILFYYYGTNDQMLMTVLFRSPVFDFASGRGTQSTGSRFDNSVASKSERSEGNSPDRK